MEALEASLRDAVAQGKQLKSELVVSGQQNKQLKNQVSQSKEKVITSELKLETWMTQVKTDLANLL